MDVETLINTLIKLFDEELNDLYLGHPYNLSRVSKMKEICHLLTYYKYVILDDDDIMKIVRFYD